MKYGVISDTHYHLFNQFGGSIDDNGTNERLRIQLNATLVAAKAMKKAGCTRLVHCGDMFHVRGAISPIVLNSVLDLYMQIVNEVMLPVDIIAGNHDLETTHSVFSANASSALQALGCNVYCSREPTIKGNHIFISWFESSSELMRVLADTAKTLGKKAKDHHVFIHAPLNDVIIGIPDTGLDPKALATLGFGRIFSGHYHNHKSFDGDIYSVGALTHHNWGDSHSLAGYLMVDGETVTHHETTAPKFLDFATCEESDIAGNYIRVSGLVSSDEEAADARLRLSKMGAAGVVASFVKSATVVATSSESAKIDALPVAISSYAKRYAVTAEIDAETLVSTCLDVLSEAEGLAE